MEKIIEQILLGDKRSAAKAISILENGSIDEKKQLLSLINKYTGKASIIGITGPPGAGKSTLLDGLIREIRKNNLTVGVLAVDPSSPFTGGAVLGDRIRMQKHATDEGVFIRSMSNRGSLGGLARDTKNAVKVLDALGLDIILIETVGVGQAEFDIINISDSTILVLHPSSGDSVQAIKAGIMEVADIFVVNKADIPEAQKLVNEIELILDKGIKNDNWKQPVIATIASEQQGIPELWGKITEHLFFLEENEFITENRMKSLEKELIDNIHDLVQEKLNSFMTTGNYTIIKTKLDKGEISSIEASEILLEELF